MSNRSGLGRGLASLIPSAAEESGIPQESVDELRINLIEPNPDQPRSEIDEEKIAELSASIAKHGVLQPILVRPRGEKYEIVAGERRWRASRLAGLDKIPARIASFNDTESLEIALIENLQREDLNPIEAAYGYKRIIADKKITQTELAELISKSRVSITNAMRLLELPEEVQALVFEGSLSAGHARAILAVQDENTRIKLAQKAVADGLSVRAVEALARFSDGGIVAGGTKRSTSPKSYKAAARKLRRLLGTNVRVKKTKDRSKIEIEFIDEEDLTRIYRTLTGDEKPLVRGVS